MKKLLTYGEAHAERQANINSWKYAFDEVPDLKPHREKMSKQEAGMYYTKKINTAFEKLGYKKKELTVEDFDSVEDYFGYYEALKIKSKTGGIL